MPVYAASLALIAISCRFATANAFVPKSDLPRRATAARDVPPGRSPRQQVAIAMTHRLLGNDDKGDANGSDGPSSETIPDATSTNGGRGGGRVSVQIVTDLPHASSALEARAAWIEHHWLKGGGLPVWVMDRSDKGGKGDGTVHGAVMRRLIAPIMMEEVVDLAEAAVDTTSARDETLVIQYRVTKPGPALAPDLVSGSHLGTVTFQPHPNGEGCRMVWTVQFDTRRWVGLYQRVTEFTIGTAARTVAESTSVPRVLTLDATLQGITDPVEARRQWLDFVWASGGGLPLFPPIPRGEILPEGGGMARRELLRVPPLISEKIVAMSSTELEGAELEYELHRPGWTTFPFLMHTHHATVRFAKKDVNAVALHWEVRIRPFPIPAVAPLVEKLTEMTVATLVRNFVVHVAEPGARVEIRPPRRGNGELVGGGVRSFGSVPKDSWIGGVLHAHLGDGRSTMEQTWSLLRPWTWGRSGKGDELDQYVRYNWKDKQ